MKIHCPYDKLINPKELKPNPKNPNAHDKDQIERLCKILEYQGWRYPIKVSNQSGFITSGHGRLACSLKMNLKEVPVSYQDYDNEDQEYADLVSDNAIASWSNLDLSQINLEVPNLAPEFNIELLGIKNFTIDISDKGQCDEDEVPEHVEPKSKLGDIYTLGNHRLFCGDSTNILNVETLMNGEKAELCFTSPPYSDQRDYSGQLELDPAHLAKFLIAPCELFVVNLGLQRKDNEIFPYWNAYLNMAKEIGLKFISWNIWDKMESGRVGNLTAMFPIEHEWIFVFGNKKNLNRTVQSVSAGLLKVKKFAVREASGKITYRKNGTVTPDTKKLGTVLSMSPYKARNEGLAHPAVFPVDFATIHIEALTSRGEYVYEPFGGSGSTLIACEKTNRKCFMMEIDPHYCDVVIARWEKYTGKSAQLQRNES